MDCQCANQCHFIKIVAGQHLLNLLFFVFVVYLIQAQAKLDIFKNRQRIVQSVIIWHKANRFALCPANLTLCRL